ncbi:MAG TPA: DVU3141 family protein [Haliangium sp.]|nr:DVU3141 family protein [Haliangium sp.]
MRPFFHALALSAALAVGCAGPRQGPEHAAVSPPSAVAPGDELERELLRRLPELPAEQPVAIHDATVIARAPYFAASGRTCRALTIEASGSPSRARLACREDGSWFFVPQIFRSEATDASHGP